MAKKKSILSGMYRDLEEILDKNGKRCSADDICAYFPNISPQFIWALATDNIRRCDELTQAIGNLQATIEAEKFPADEQLTMRMMSIYSKHIHQRRIYKEITTYFNEETCRKYIAEDEELASVLSTMVESKKSTTLCLEDYIFTIEDLVPRSFSVPSKETCTNNPYLDYFLNKVDEYFDFVNFLDKKSNEFRAIGMPASENDVDGSCAKIEGIYNSLDDAYQELLKLAEFQMMLN